MNDSGQVVYQVLTECRSNVQASPGGDGWVRLMEFDLERNSIHFRTNSSLLHKWAAMNGESAFNEAPEFSDFTLPMPVQGVATTRGHVWKDWQLAGQSLGIRRSGICEDPLEGPAPLEVAVLKGGAQPRCTLRDIRVSGGDRCHHRCEVPSCC